MWRILIPCLLFGALGLADLKSEFSESREARRLKENKKKKKEKEHEAVKSLKAAIIKLQEEKTSLSTEVKMNAEQAAQKAQMLSQLTGKVSEKDTIITQLKEELSKKNPSCSNDEASLNAQRTAELSAEAVRQQKEIANLTAALSAMKIKYQLLEEEFGDPSLRFFLAAKATKVYQDPGIQGAANKTFKYVLPHVSEALKTGEEVYSAMNASVLEGIHSLLGSESSVEPWLPLVSAFLVYGMICCPVGVVLTYVVDFVCSVKEILLACGFYLVCVSIMSCGFVMTTQRDPLKELAQNDPSILLLQQLGFAAILLFYLIMLGVVTCVAACDDKLPFSVIITRLIQAAFMLVFAMSYYRLVWTPTMVDELPLVEEIFSRDGKTPSVLPYMLTVVGFSGNFVLEWRTRSAEKVAEEEKDGKGA